MSYHAFVLQDALKKENQTQEYLHGCNYWQQILALIKQSTLLSSYISKFSHQRVYFPNLSIVDSFRHVIKYKYFSFSEVKPNAWKCVLIDSHKKKKRRIRLHQRCTIQNPLKKWVHPCGNNNLLSLVTAFSTISLRLITGLWL